MILVALEHHEKIFLAENIDHAKDCIDRFGPGGNYILSVDMILMNLSDAKPENLKAVLEYVHENGKY